MWSTWHQIIATLKKYWTKHLGTSTSIDLNASYNHLSGWNFTYAANWWDGPATLKSWSAATKGSISGSSKCQFQDCTQFDFSTGLLRGAKRMIHPRKRPGKGKSSGNIQFWDYGCCMQLGGGLSRGAAIISTWAGAVYTSVYHQCTSIVSPGARNVAPLSMYIVERAASSSFKMLYSCPRGPHKAT